MSTGVESALHTLFYMAELPVGQVVGVKKLAELHGASSTYLSKIFTKLRKSGIVRSVPGVNGGYELARSTEDISFWDVVEAVEGPSYMFQCAEIRQKNMLFDKAHAKENAKCPCLIKVVMVDAEELMRDYLKKKSLKWLQTEVNKGFSADDKKAIIDWSKIVSGK